jgi:FkbM family methyltransferase
MQNLYEAAKYLLLNYLPRPALQYLKRAHYARALKNFSLEHEPDMKIVRHLACPGDFVVDIGANIGLYTKVLSELVGGHGRVFSIEPVPGTYDILSSNVQKLRLGNVVPINRAVSDSNCTVAMNIPRHLNKAENFYRAHIVDGEAGNECAAMEVQAQTLDSIFRDHLDRFTFVKCDVEGHELRCVRGARGFLEGADATWLIEVSDDPDDDLSRAHALFQELSLKGYSPWWFDGQILRERKRGDRCLNCFFLKARHVQSLRLQAGHLFEREA